MDQLVLHVCIAIVVKPRPVTKLTVKSQNSTSMVVSWVHPEQLDSDWFPVIYEVQYWVNGKKVGACGPLPMVACPPSPLGSKVGAERT